MCYRWHSELGVRTVSSSSVRPPGVELQTVSDAVMNSWSWIDTLVSVGAILAGAWIVKWQVRQNAREGLRLEIYHDIHKASRELMLAEIDATSFARGTLSTLQLLQNPDMSIMLSSFQTRRAINFADLSSQLGDKMTSLMSELEKYEIASPELKIFRTALSVASTDMWDTQQPLFQAYLVCMSGDVSEAAQVPGQPSVIHQMLPDVEGMARIEALTDGYIAATDKIGNLYFDLGVETQNLLLGSLFKPCLSGCNPHPLYVGCAVIRQARVSEWKLMF